MHADIDWSVYMPEWRHHVSWETQRRYKWLKRHLAKAKHNQQKRSTLQKWFQKKLSAEEMDMTQLKVNKFEDFLLM